MNKGLLLWTEIVCAGCATPTAGEFVRHGRRQMRMVKADLKKGGWIVKGGEAYCPNCISLDHSMGVPLPTPFKGAL